MQTLGIREFNQLYKIFSEYWNLKTEDYYLAEISEITFTYKIIDTKLMHSSVPKLTTKILKPNSKVKSNSNPNENNKFKFGGFNLPLTMDFTTWGGCHFINDSYAIVYKKSSSLEYHIKLFNNYYDVEVRSNDKTIFRFKDTNNQTNDLSCFTRVLKNQEYVFDNGNVIIKKNHKKVSFLNKIRKDMYNSKNFITMDLETRIINGIMSSYCVSIFDGKDCKSFYITDFLNEKDMLRESIIYLMKRRYHNHKVYLHNFSFFDSVFLLSTITELSDSVFPIMREGSFINIKFNFANKYTLYFKDSFLLLPASLRDLATNFEVESKIKIKILIYKFVNNPNIPLDYVGKFPDFNYFTGISLEEYKLYSSEYNNKDWSLRTETIKYCELDCVVLYQIINKFSDQIFSMFRVDIIKYSTLSSLAFAIYKSNFLKDSNIPLIHGEIYEFIKQSYTGGSVDVYKPKPSVSPNPNNKITVKRYDVNSLYPFAMKSFPMPVGSPIYFEGDILQNYDPDNKPFGIFEVDIVAPSNIKYPLLQTRIKTGKLNRTIAPIGSWSGVYFSDELYNAGKYGYTYKVKRGYLFDRGNIFTEYVDYLYNLKEQSQKNTPNYTISKLLLNSLYGRLGMNPIAEQHIIVNNDKAIELYSKFNITNILDLNNGKELISFFNLPSPENDINNSNIKETSVAIASVVTASARIHMSIFKTNNKIVILYSDTDSLDLESFLDPKYVGTKLGQMKLEHVFDDAIFLAPKMYGGKTSEYEYVKIKGLKNPIAFDELKPLLKKDSSLEIKQEKWYNDFSNSQIHVKDEIYTLMVTDNKRELIYNENGEFIDTKPLVLDNGVLVNQEEKEE